MPTIGSGLPTTGRDRVLRGCSRCRCRPASRSCSSRCLRRPRTAIRSTSFLPSVEVRAEVACPSRWRRPTGRTWSSSVSSHLILRSMRGDAHVAPLLRVLVRRREIGKREPRLDALQLDTVGIHALVAAGARTLERDHQAAVSSLIGVHRSWTLRYHAMPVGPQYSSEFGNDVRVGERAPVLAGAERARARPTRGAGGTWSAPRRRRCRTARTRRWSSSRRARSASRTLTPRRLCRTPANVLLSSPNWSSNVGQLGQPQGVVPVRDRSA